MFESKYFASLKKVLGELSGSDLLYGNFSPHLREDFGIFSQRLLEEPLLKQFPYGKVHASFVHNELLDSFPTSDEDITFGVYNNQVVSLQFMGIVLTHKELSPKQNSSNLFNEKNLALLEDFFKDHVNRKQTLSYRYQKLSEQNMSPDEISKILSKPPEDFSPKSCDLEFFSDEREYKETLKRERELRNDTFGWDCFDVYPLFAAYFLVDGATYRAIKNAFHCARAYVSGFSNGTANFDNILNDVLERKPLNIGNIEGMSVYLRSTKEVGALYFYEAAKNFSKPLINTNSGVFLEIMEKFYFNFIDDSRRLEYEYFV